MKYKVQKEVERTKLGKLNNWKYFCCVLLPLLFSLVFLRLHFLSKQNLSCTNGHKLNCCHGKGNHDTPSWAHNKSETKYNCTLLDLIAALGH